MTSYLMNTNTGKVIPIDLEVNSLLESFLKPALQVRNHSYSPPPPIEYNVWCVVPDVCLCNHVLKVQVLTDQTSEDIEIPQPLLISFRQLFSSDHIANFENTK